MQQFLISEYFEENEPVSIDFYIEHRELNMHSHEFWEISYVFEGKGVHHFENGKSQPIREGDFIFVSPGISHCITSPPPDKGNWVHVCNFLITPEHMKWISERLSSIRELDEYTLPRMIAGSAPFCLQMKSGSASVYSLMLAAAHEYRHFTNGSTQIIQNSTISLFIYITRLYENTLKQEHVMTTKKDVIDDLSKLIKTNFGSPLTLDYLASYTHLSPEYLSRYVKKCTGINLSDFIRETRMERAKYMLRNSNLSISEISSYCGYGSIGNFQKVFRKYTGMSAGEYRRSN